MCTRARTHIHTHTRGHTLPHIFQYVSLPSYVCVHLWQLSVSLFSSIYPPPSLFIFLDSEHTTCHSFLKYPSSPPRPFFLSLSLCIPLMSSSLQSSFCTFIFVIGILGNQSRCRAKREKETSSKRERGRRERRGDERLDVALVLWRKVSPLSTV